MSQSSWQVGQALLSVTVLALLLGLAIASDLRAHRIPNRLIGLGLAAALMLHAWALAADAASLAGTSWWSPLAGATVGAALLLPLHLSGGMGAGDVKLMAMAGAFVGARGAAWSALYALALGGLACGVAALWSVASRRRAASSQASAQAARATPGLAAVAGPRRAGRPDRAGRAGRAGRPGDGGPDRRRS